MIRLAWRQFRAQAIVALGVLAVIAVVLAITGPHLVSVYDANVATCKANRGPSANCVNGVTNTYRFLQAALDALVLVVPALIGVFWGAPLVAREIEGGTFRLAWTQSVTRTRWLAIKLAVVGLSSLAVAGLLSLMVTWWSSPVDTVNANRFSSAAFGLRGLVPIGYAAFAFAFGVTAGALIRRTLPAMATTLVGFVGARLAVTYWVRPHLMSPVRASMAVNTSSGLGISKSSSGLSVMAPSVNIPNAWVYSSQLADRAGNAPTSQFVRTACQNLLAGLPGPPLNAGKGTLRVRAGSSNPFQSCMAKIASKFHLVVSYQPVNRYWPFQWYEMAIFLAAARCWLDFAFGGSVAGWFSYIRLRWPMLLADRLFHLCRIDER
jgi:ABC-type transport system involved in multi-copper enzyme maturation permease subunit